MEFCLFFKKYLAYFFFLCYDELESNGSLGGDVMSKHIVTINKKSLQDSIKFEGCSECQTSCQSACKTSCTIGNLTCTTMEEADEMKLAKEA